jgi:hypothetical protein
MTNVGWAHAASIPAMTLVVAFIFSLNIQGPRKALVNEPVWRGTLRRFLKIMGLMAYSMIVVQFLTLAARAPHGSAVLGVTAQTFYTGCAMLMIGPIALYLAGTILLWIIGAIIGVDLEAKLFEALGGRAAEPAKEGSGGSR